MDGIDLMAGAMHAAQARLGISAANLANVSSAGFRRRIAHATLSSRGLSVWTTVAGEQGPLERTGRAFDLSAIGGGFVVRDAHGRAVIQRSASFTLDANRRLVDERGGALLDARGNLVRATPDATIDALGVVRSNGEPIARLRLTPGASIERAASRKRFDCEGCGMSILSNGPTPSSSSGRSMASPSIISMRASTLFSLLFSRWNLNAASLSSQLQTRALFAMSIE